jgi:hypothetical protein
LAGAVARAPLAGRARFFVVFFLLATGSAWPLARGGLRPIRSAAKALGQRSATGQPAHCGERAVQILRPWKINT